MNKTVKHYNAESFTDADFKLARDSWRLDLCGNEHSNSLSVKGISEILRMRDEDSEDLRRQFNRSPHAPILFGEDPPKLSGELKPQYDRLLRVALPFGTVGCRSYHSRELLKDVLYGLELLYEKMYGENVVTDTSFRSWKEFDWWDWYVGAACPLMDILMIIEDFADPELIKKYVTPVAFLRHKMRTAPNAAEAMSRIVTLTPLALLTCDRDLLQRLFCECEMLLESHDSGDNMRRDYCCMTHGMPYNVAYGVINLSRIGKVVQILSRSPLAYPLLNADNLKGMLRYTFAPVLYRGRTLAPMNGRAMQYDSSAATVLREAHYLYGLFGDEFDREISELIARNGSPEVREQLISSYDGEMTLEKYRKINSIPGTRAAECPKTHIFSYRRYYESLVNNGQDLQSPDNAYFWYSGDIGAWHRHGCMVGLRMPSARSYGYECMNGDNGDGWYTGEGALYLYTPEGCDEYSPEWWKSADKHLIPGTTVDDRKREIMFFNKAWRCSRDFVGGITLDGQFMTASMDFEAFHNEIDEGREDLGYGRGLPIHRCTLTAKKSWFFFDRVIVAMGCDIDAHDGYGIRTVIENRMLDGDCHIAADGNRIDFKEGEISLFAQRIYIPHTGGFIFPEGGHITVRFYSDNGKKLVALWLDHGIDPCGGKYVYFILPNATEHEVVHYSAEDVEILASNGMIQGARERSSGLCGMIFRKAGELDGINAHQGMIAMLRRDECGRICSLAVCDPTQMREKFSFEADGEMHEILTDTARGRGYVIV